MTSKIWYPVLLFLQSLMFQTKLLAVLEWQYRKSNLVEEPKNRRLETSLNRIMRCIGRPFKLNVKWLNVAFPTILILSLFFKLLSKWKHRVSMYENRNSFGSWSGRELCKKSIEMPFNRSNGLGLKIYSVEILFYLNNEMLG